MVRIRVLSVGGANAALVADLYQPKSKPGVSELPEKSGHDAGVLSKPVCP